MLRGVYPEIIRKTQHDMIGAVILNIVKDLVRTSQEIGQSNPAGRKI